MKIVVRKIGCKPEIREIKGELHEMQEIVGGYIECFHLGIGNILCVCNEDGKYIGFLPNFIFNGDVIVGDVFFCAAGEEDFEGLTDLQAELVITMLNMLDAEL